jgi:hypothetical protein
VNGAVYTLPKLGVITLGLVLLALIGCGQMGRRKVFVTVDVVNVSSNHLNWVKLKDGDRQLFSAGVMIPNTEKTSLDYVWSNMPAQAKLTFIDDQTRQAYSINVSLKEADARVHSGQCKRVAIRILGYDKAEVVCK